MAMMKGLKMTCDVCGRVEFVEENGIDNSEEWEVDTEVGDLCPCCKLQWNDWKTTFVTKIRKETKGDLR